MKNNIEHIAYIVMLGVSMIFGFLGQTAEMALAIVAGAIAFSFANIERFSKIKGAGFEAEFKDKIQSVIEKETEPAADGEQGYPVPDPKQIDLKTRKIINALQHPEYTWRYIGGVKKDTGLSREEISTSIEWLMKHGYVRQSLGKSGPIWSLTEYGRHLTAVIAFENVQVPKKA